MTVLELDLSTIKGRRRLTWASANYGAVAAPIVPMAERLVRAADLRAGDAVLAVATGAGNAALAAAPSRGDVSGLDYVPALLDGGRARALAEGLEVTFTEGDAERLPYPDHSFDAVLSCVGVMFTPDQQRAAAELVRVCRPGGRIALANWTPTGFVGGMLRTVSKHVPPPAGLKPAGLWATEQRLRGLCAGAISDLRIERRHFVFRFRSAGDFVEFFRAHYGPLAKAFDALDHAGREHLHADLAALAVAYGRPAGSSIAIPSQYLEAIAIAR